MPSITIAQTTYKRIQGCALSAFDDTGSVYNSDGTVTVPCDNGTYKLLIASGDPDARLNRLINNYEMVK